MDGHKITELLGEKLQMEFPPVALAFTDECPDGAYILAKEPPSFCALWRWGEDRVFYASAAEHLGCPIGGMVSGFASPDDNPAEMTQALLEMCEVGDYDPEEEIANTARFKHDNRGIVYGPLWQYTLEPLVVFMWMTLPQMGVLQEIVGKIMWRENPQGATFARPACSVLPIAETHGQVAMSPGCAGMRAYTEMSPQYVLTAIPGSKLDDLETGLREKTDADERLRFYQERLASGMAGRA
ncbi:MAG: DUF169 domain-containing protein [SAR202 cluster bacterium]|jgi:uncharacterized protein (DUF169 family)|nr:DUF169 domain-containing protein [SAR202 cluster bacterium]